MHRDARDACDARDARDAEHLCTGLTHDLSDSTAGKHCGPGYSGRETERATLEAIKAPLSQRVLELRRPKGGS